MDRLNTLYQIRFFFFCLHQIQMNKQRMTLQILFAMIITKSCLMMMIMMIMVINVKQKKCYRIGTSQQTKHMFCCNFENRYSVSMIITTKQNLTLAIYSMMMNIIIDQDKDGIIIRTSSM